MTAKWTNDRISTYSLNSPTAWEAKRMYDAMKLVRDDMQSEIDKLQAEKDEAISIIQSLGLPIEDIHVEITTRPKYRTGGSDDQAGPPTDSAT